MAAHDLAVLEWYAENGVDEALSDEAVDRFAQNSAPVTPSPKSDKQPPVPLQSSVTPLHTEKADLSDVTSLDALENAIKTYNGIGLKRSAKNCVFADGNPKAHVMIIGEGPGADEDRQGVPFVGVSGQLLDKILAAINLDRTADAPEKSVYITNIINWRPPGNRTPTQDEMTLSLPFIEKHIALIKPKVIVMTGGVAAKTLLHTDKAISKLRGGFHDYVPQTIDGESPIPAIATYHPAYLLRNPVQKRAVWQDMLRLKAFLENASMHSA